MIHKTILILFFKFLIATQITAQAKSELFAGWNHLINLGASVNSNFSLNPRVGQEGNAMQFGIDLEIDNINIDSDFIFENNFKLNLALSQSSSNGIEVPEENEIITPFKKNYDYLSLRTKYSKQINYSNNFIAAESYHSTQLTPSYTDNYLKQHIKEHELLSELLSPLTSTFSIGYERRNDFDYVIYFSPVTSKIIYVNNKELAGRPALEITNDTTIYLGSSLHGNDLEYDIESQEVKSFKKTRFFFGSQLTLEFNKELIADKLFVQSDTRLFYNYNGPTKHLDIQTRASIRVTILNGLSLGLTAEYINDDNLFFQDLSQQQTNSSSTKLIRGSSYNHRLVLNYTLSK